VAFIAAKGAFLSVNGVNISQFLNSIESNRKVDSIDTTTFGQLGHTYQGGLTDGTLSCAGLYDSSAGGPKAVMEPLMQGGALVPLIYRPEGTGSGKPQQTCNGLVSTYVESSALNDMIKWTTEIQLSGTVTNTAQP
jgi:hypothetical protein